MSDGSEVIRRGDVGGGDRKMCEGWLEHKNSSQTAGQSWQRVWFVLKGNTIYVFKSEVATTDNQLGNLTIDAETTFLVREKGDARKGYKFELRTRGRVNRFKTSKSSQREEWRAYILGLAKGQVPGNVDLLQTDIDRIQTDIDAYRQGYRYSLAQDSGVFMDGVSGVTGFGTTGTGSSGSRNSSLDQGGPIMTHRFYRERSDTRIPSWFFSRCSRQSAESILRDFDQHGNTLLRESSTFKDNGSYVISKSYLNSQRGQVEVEHYEVMRVARGYKINVENEQPELTCLSDVMDFFVSTTGGLAVLMKTNDPRQFGIEEPDYNTGRIRGQPPEPDPQPWAWPPPDYDDTGRRPRFQPGAAQTVTPGILKKSQPTPDTHEPRWSGQPATVAPSWRRESRRPQANMADIENRVHQTETLKDLDAAIDTGFQHDQLYVNIPDMAPPPPLPHKSAPHSYINNSPAHADSEDPHLRELPEAPPPPTYRNRNSMSALSPPVQTTPRPVSYQSRQQSVSPTRSALHQPGSSPPKNSLAFPAKSPEGKPGTFVVPQLKKTSDSMFKGLPKSPGSPASFPTWTEPKQILKNTKSPEDNKPVDVTSAKNANDTSNAAASGVDDTNPGGVGDLKSRFEQQQPSSLRAQPPSSRASAGPGLGKATSTSSLPRPRPASTSGLTGYQALPHSASFSVTNTRKQSVTNTNTRASCGPSVAGGRTNTNIDARVSFGLAGPDDEDYFYDDTAVMDEDPNLKSGLSAEFKKKLENTIGGGGTMPNRPSGPGPARHGPKEEERVYEELPEIVPDAVTYVNEKYNT